MNHPRLLLGDCLERMREIADGSVDMVLCDLPYGTTACKWDSVIPFEPLWAEYRRVTRPNAAMVLFSAQPFTTALIASNMGEFRYDWVWSKNLPTGFVNANKMPMRAHETLCVFYRALPTYNKQPTATKITDRKMGTVNGYRGGGTPDVYGGVQSRGISVVKPEVCPRSVLEIPCVPRATGTLHPTQKPVALCEYLIRTYTNEGDAVLDNTMGSGTTGVACMNTGRHFIGIERDPGYFETARKRIEAAQEPAALAA